MVSGSGILEGEKGATLYLNIEGIINFNNIQTGKDVTKSLYRLVSPYSCIDISNTRR